MRILICLLLFRRSARGADAQRRRHRHRDRDRAEWWEGRGPVEFGVRAGNDFEEDVGSAGAQLRIPLVRQLLLVPSGDVFFGDARDGVAAQRRPDGAAGAARRPLRRGRRGLRAARLRPRRRRRRWSAGYNLVLGMGGGRLLDTRVQPFAEGRWTDMDHYQPFRLVVGIDVPVR